ncbi:hypothetical protein [Ligilactobacillus acidipiscis]|nr:hypothetical protein [Ligilactobacillus acidipiscis]
MQKNFVILSKKKQKQIVAKNGHHYFCYFSINHGQYITADS